MKSICDQSDKAAIKDSDAAFTPSRKAFAGFDFRISGTSGPLTATSKNAGRKIPTVETTVPRIPPRMNPIKVAVVNTGPGDVTGPGKNARQSEVGKRSYPREGSPIPLLPRDVLLSRAKPWLPAALSQNSQYALSTARHPSSYQFTGKQTARRPHPCRAPSSCTPRACSTSKPAASRPPAKFWFKATSSWKSART
jgi:hypothetical protein